MAIISSNKQPQEPKRQKSAAEKPANYNASSPSLLEPQAIGDEDSNKQEEKIRPQRLADYIGQKDL